MPQIPGSTIVRLDESNDRARLDPGTNRARGRQDNSARAPRPPRPATGIRLGEPAPFGTDARSLRRSDPMPLTPDLGGEPTRVSPPSSAPRCRAPRKPGRARRPRYPMPIDY